GCHHGCGCHGCGHGCGGCGCVSIGVGCGGWWGGGCGGCGGGGGGTCGVAAVAAAGAEGTGAGATATASGVVDGDNVRFALSCINSSNPAECAVRRELGLWSEAVVPGFSSLRQCVPSDLVSRGAT